MLWLCVNSREGNCHEGFFLNNDVCHFLRLQFLKDLGVTWYLIFCTVMFLKIRSTGFQRKEIKLRCKQGHKVEIRSTSFEKGQ